MRRISCTFVCVLAVLAVAPPAVAEIEPSVNDLPLSSFVKTRQYVEDLRRYLIGYESWIGPCPDPDPGVRVRTLVPKQSLPFPGVDGPAAPQWIEIIRIGGCSTPYERPVHVGVSAGKTVFYAHLLGSTRTQPVLQHKAMTALIAAEKRAAIRSGCQQTHPVRVLTTAFVSETRAEYGTAWREVWTLANCRGLKKVPIRFTPDHTGGISFAFEGLPTQ
ncbi:MAG: hypothetical protein ACR2PM_19725 [Hyphomicrobiales bacterium]